MILDMFFHILVFMKIFTLLWIILFSQIGTNMYKNIIYECRNTVFGASFAPLYHLLKVEVEGMGSERHLYPEGFIWGQHIEIFWDTCSTIYFGQKSVLEIFTVETFTGKNIWFSSIPPSGYGSAKAHLGHFRVRSLGLYLLLLTHG